MPKKSPLLKAMEARAKKKAEKAAESQVSPDPAEPGDPVHDELVEALKDALAAMGWEGTVEDYIAALEANEKV